MTPEQAQTVWDMAYKFWPNDAAFRYFARQPKTDEVFGMALSGAVNLECISQWADNTERNSYWQPNPTNKTFATRCSAQDILSWSYFLVDIDPVSESYDAWACANKALKNLSELLKVRRGRILSYTAIDSGRGVQLLFPLGWHATGSTILVSGDAHPRVLRDVAPRVMSYWLGQLKASLGSDGIAYGCTVDTSCSDLPRVMRLPYTINQKTGRTTDILVQADRPEELLYHRLVTRAPDSVWEQPELAPLEGTSYWMEYLPYMTVSGRRFLTEGATEPGRRFAAASAMLSMHELGATQEQIQEALRHGGDLCSPALPPDETDSMVIRKFRRG